LRKKRVFVAIGLPEALLGELEVLQTRLKPYARDAKWVKVNSIHLTLKFLGYVEPDSIPTITDALRECAKGTTPIAIQAAGCGFFPNARRPNVLWVGVSSSPLQPLQEKIEEAMETLDFEKENRAFSPHLTLARFKDPRGLLPLAKETETLAGKSFGDFTAHNFSLYESILHPKGAEYHVIENFNLEQPQMNTINTDKN
jgi:RNA 2',3'-cyclic 3'-phosphodiesterase